MAFKLGDERAVNHGSHLDSSYRDHYQFRQYQSYVNPFLVNLEANPPQRQTTFADLTIQCVVTDPTASSELTGLDLAIFRAQALDIPIYPAARVFSNATSSFSEWVSIAYWETYAERFRTLAAHRPAGEKRLGIDAENYSGVGNAEPTIAALTQAGYTVQQFKAAVKPFMDTLVELDAYVCVYPAVHGESDLMHQFIVSAIESLGVDHVEVWWEDSFNFSEHRRLSPVTTWPAVVASMREHEAQWDRSMEMDGIRHRHIADDDVFRTWGAPFRSDIDKMGRFRPWVWDLTRVDRLSMGTAAWELGTTIKSANSASTVFVFPAMQFGNTSDYSVGTSLTQSRWAFATNTSGGVGGGYDARRDANGVRFNPTSSLHGTIRVTSSLPIVTGGPWMIDMDCFQVPSGTLVDIPCFSQAQYNSGIWQVYYRVSGSAVVLQIKSGSAGSRLEYVIADNLSVDTDIRVQVGQSGSQWLYSAGSGTVNRVNIGFSTVPLSTGLIVLGGGQTPGTFATNNTQEGGRNVFFSGQMVVFSYLPSDAEITGTIRTGHYPWGRGT